MSVESLLSEPGRVEEPRAGQEYSDVLTHVATERKPVIVCRNGADLAAVVPLEHLELLREMAVREELEKLAAQIDWARLPKSHRPSQEWFEANDDPFAPEEEPAT